MKDEPLVKNDSTPMTFDAQFRVVFDAIRQLMAPSHPAKKKIGFMTKERRAAYGRK